MQTLQYYCNIVAKYIEMHTFKIIIKNENNYTTHGRRGIYSKYTIIIISFIGYLKYKKNCGNQ